MARFLFLTVALAMAAMGGTSATQAKASSTPVGCASLYGDIWGQNKSSAARREIDGALIKIPSDFMRMTGTREAGLKIVKGGDFSGWNFSSIPLSDICFENSKLTDVDFAGVRASGIGFVKSDLTGANMRGARMPAVFFRDANLAGVAAQGADFSGGHFDGGWFDGGFVGWNIDGANLSDFVFDCGITVQDGCPVNQGDAGISAKGANFNRATLHSFRLHNMDLSGAWLENTIVSPDQLSHLATADFHGDIILRGGGSDVRLTTSEAKYLLAGNSRQKAAEAHPSFNCEKAASKVELAICGEYADDLRAADRELAKLYQQAKENSNGVQASQRAWLKKRNRCGVAEYPTDCIRESYSDRKGQLLGLLGETQWLARGEAALFIDDMLPLPATVLKTDLFARIAPALVGASRTEILVERGPDGLYAIRGSAVGSNAHLCSIYASHLYFDKGSGWYGPVSEGNAIPIFRIWDGRLEIFADGRPDYDQFPEAADFMSCGMRAHLGKTIRVPVGDALLESYRESLSQDM